MSDDDRVRRGHDPRDPLGRAVLEAVCAYATDDLAARALGTALSRAGLEGVPRSPRSLRRFCDQWLRPEVVTLIGDEGAEGVAARLALVIDAIDWRDAGGPPAASREQTWSPEQVEGARVVVVSSEPRVAAGLRLELRGRAAVITHVGLADAVERGTLARGRAVMVIDGRTEDPVGSLASQVSAEALVAVLAWGVRDAVSTRVRESLPREVPIVRCGEEVTIEELALLVGARLGLR